MLLLLVLLAGPVSAAALEVDVSCDGQTCLRETRGAYGGLMLRETLEDDAGQPGALLRKERYRAFLGAPSLLWRAFDYERSEDGSRWVRDSRFDSSSGTSRLTVRVHFGYDEQGRHVTKRERFGADPFAPVHVAWFVRSGSGVAVSKVRKQIGSTGFVLDRVIDVESGLRGWDLWFDANAAMILRASQRYDAGQLATTTFYDANGDIDGYYDAAGMPLVMPDAIVPAAGTAFGRFLEWTADITALIASQPVDLYFLGDSITQLFTWPDFGLAVWDAYYADRWAVSGGISLDRTQNLLWRLGNGNLDAVAPKLVVLNIGVNNISLDDDPPEEVAEGVLAVLTKIGSTLPYTKVLLMGVFPSGELADAPNRLPTLRLNPLLRGFADDDRVAFLDIGDQLVDEDGRLLDVTDDFLHPNEAGYEIWAANIERTVRETLGELTPWHSAGLAHWPR